MRKLLLFLLLFWAGVARGQTTTQYLGGPNTLVHNRGYERVDSGSYLAIRDTNFTPARIGLVVFRSIDGIVYVSVSTTAPKKWGSLAGMNTEVDPVFTISPAFAISGTDITNWNAAYGWGNHAGLYALLSGSYADPSWLSSLAWSKITGTPTTLAGYGITDPVVLTSGSYSNPSWITSLAWSKITGAPSFLTNITGLVTQGSNVTITGAGTAASPYNISSTPIDTSGKFVQVRSSGVQPGASFNIGGTGSVGSLVLTPITGTNPATVPGQFLYNQTDLKAYYNRAGTLRGILDDNSGIQNLGASTYQSGSIRLTGTIYAQTLISAYNSSLRGTTLIPASTNYSAVRWSANNNYAGIRGGVANGAFEFCKDNTGTSADPDTWVPYAILDNPASGSRLSLSGYYVPTTIFTQTATATVAATTTETTLLGSGVGTLTVPAGYFTAGRTIEIEVAGVYSTPGASVGNLTVNVYLGGTVVATGTANALPVSGSNLSWKSKVTFTCRTAGTSGTVMSTGDLTYSVGNNAAWYSTSVNNGTTTATVNTSAAPLAIDVKVQWSNNTAGNSISSYTAIVKSFN